MVAIDSTPIQIGNDTVTKYEGGATTTLETYTFPSTQDTITVFNDSVQRLTVIASGKTHRIAPNVGYQITEDTDTLQIKTEVGYQPFRLEGRVNLGIKDMYARGEVAKAMSQLADVTLNITKYKTDTNNWNDAFESAYADLPVYGGRILIPQNITITRSINLHSLGTKKVLIEGNGKMNNPGVNYNSVIIKQGDFDGVILAHGCGMRRIGVSRDTLFADTHDGIHVSGITCTLEDVQVNQQGGNGIRIGSKTETGDFNCNIGRFTNVGSYNNAGWGIVVRDDFSTGINTSDANALVFIAPDVRANTLGGMLFEKCMDNQVYSPDCEVNTGEAGIKIGEETSGISIYSSYTENAGATHDILLTAGSKDCMIIGYRSGINNDRITDLGVGNYVLGKYASKFAGYYLKNMLNAKGYNIGKTSTNGYFSIEQEDNHSLSIVARGGAAKWLTLKSDSGLLDISLLLKDITLGGKDRLNSIRVRPSVSTVETIVPAGGSVSANRTGTGVKVGDMLLVNPVTTLPSGISFYANCEVDDNVKITLVNGTANSVTVPAQTWRCVSFNATALT